MNFPTDVEKTEERERKRALGKLKPAPTSSKPRGGARPNAGRKSRYTVPTERAVVNVPHEFTEALIERYGTLQKAIESLALSLDQSLDEFVKPEFRNK